MNGFLDLIGNQKNGLRLKIVNLKKKKKLIKMFVETLTFY